MRRIMRAGSVAAGLLILWIWSSATVWARPATDQHDSTAPVVVVVQVPTTPPTASGVRTITLQVGSTADQSTELRASTDASSSTPIVISTSIGDMSLANVAVDSQHGFDWTTSPVATDCGPHPAAGTPGCSTSGASTAAADSAPILPAAPESAQTVPAPSDAPAPPTPDVGNAPQPDAGAPAEADQAQPAEQQPATSAETGQQPAISAVTYTIQSGDTLRGIAQLFYGDADAFTRIAEANAGQVMDDGRLFDDPSVIQPGWRIRIPQPSRAVEERPDGSWYTVQPGDTLHGIAARLLGDASQWPELYALNGAAAGGSLTGNPNLVQPGMQLRLPAPSSPTTDVAGAPA